MNFYRQPILLFGAIIPLLIGLAIIGVAYKVKSSMEDSFETKLATYTANKNSQLAARKIESDVAQQRQNLIRWNEQLSNEIASTVSTTIKEIQKKYPSKEITQTAFDPNNSTGGIGAVSAQNSSQLRIAFRGTYRTLQRAFFELETRMPQLQLEELKIEAIRSSPSFVNVQVTYTAWEK